MTQKQRILEKLEQQEWITTLDAISMHILRLGDVIFRLKKEGYVFKSEIAPGQVYGRYKLISKPAENKKEDPVISKFKAVRDLPPAFEKKPATLFTQ